MWAFCKLGTARIWHVSSRRPRKQLLEPKFKDFNRDDILTPFRPRPINQSTPKVHAITHKSPIRQASPIAPPIMSSSMTLPEIQSNTRQEIGVMVGFIAVFLLVIAAFTVTWRRKNKRQSALEEQRQAELREKGFGMRSGLSGEKEKGVRDALGNAPLLQQQGVSAEQREGL
jgi:hypothetical protein